MIVNCIAIIGIGICIGENLLLGIGIGSVVIFLYRWNPNKYLTLHIDTCNLTLADKHPGWCVYTQCRFLVANGYAKYIWSTIVTLCATIYTMQCQQEKCVTLLHTVIVIGHHTVFVIKVYMIQSVTEYNLQVSTIGCTLP